MKSTMMKAFALVGVLAVLASADRAEARSRSAAGSAGSCFDDAGNAFAQCVDNHAWYFAARCELRYSIDVVLCIPAAALLAAVE